VSEKVQPLAEFFWRPGAVLLGPRDDGGGAATVCRDARALPAKIGGRQRVRHAL